jgi:hypothetical protein
MPLLRSAGERAFVPTVHAGVREGKHLFVCGLDPERVFVLGWSQGERPFARPSEVRSMVAITIDQRQAFPRQRVERRRRTIARRYRAAAFAALLAACAVWAQVGAADRTGSGPLAVPGAGPSQAVASRVWVVQPGDTVWGIARHLQPSGDVRPLVDRLSAEIHGRALQVGQALPVP